MNLVGLLGVLIIFFFFINIIIIIILMHFYVSGQKVSLFIVVSSTSQNPLGWGWGLRK
jgi:hypothetical protein